MKIKELKVRARETIGEYLDNWEKEYEEIDVEGPVYYADLEMCKTVHELLKYMSDFSDEWKEMYNVQKWISVIKQRERNNLKHITYENKKLISKCETYIEVLQICNKLDYSKYQIKKDYIRYTKIKPWEYNNEAI